MVNRSYFQGGTMVSSDRLVAEAGEVPGVQPAAAPA
jgi:hypothetical protein